MKRRALRAAGLEGPALTSLCPFPAGFLWEFEPRFVLDHLLLRHPACHLHAAFSFLLLPKFIPS